LTEITDVVSFATVPFLLFDRKNSIASVPKNLQESAMSDGDAGQWE
jgi:ABC-type glycerol-3-phosphate transport system permease component